MKKYYIAYGFGVAFLYTPSSDPLERFNVLASQCFGIRKCILNPCIIDVSNEQPLDPLEEEYERLEYNGEVVIWNEKGEKIKSEFDD